MGTHPIFESDFDCLTEMEIVDQEIEKVLPCFRAAVHCELLSEPEVKQILLQRKKDEAKLIKREADLSDFINFVHRDNMILKLIAKRREATSYKFKLDEIEYKLVGRLSRVMKRAQRLWPENMSVWATHIALCCQWNKRTQLSKLYEELISRHPHNVEIWLAASRFQVERNGSVDQARKLLIRAQQQNPHSAQIMDQLFRIELLNAAQINKRIAVAGGAAEQEEEENEVDSVRNGAAALRVMRLAMKTFEDEPELLSSMVWTAKGLEPQIAPVTKAVVEHLMALESLTAVPFKARFMAKFIPGGREAALNLFREATDKNRTNVELHFQFLQFAADESLSPLVDELLTHLVAVIRESDEPTPQVLANGRLVKFLSDAKMVKDALYLQQRIVAENGQAEAERLLLLELMLLSTDVDEDLVKQHFEILFKSDNEAMQEKGVELCREWAKESESRLYWFAAKKSAGKILLVERRLAESAKKGVESVLQLSASKPIDLEFLQLGIDILRAEQRPELFRFVDKCCLMSDQAELWLAMLKLYSNEKLDELGSVFVRA